MTRFYAISLGALFAVSAVMSACTIDGRVATKPSQVDVTVTAQKAQQDFQWACFALQGAHAAFQAFSPLFKTSLDQSALNTEADAAAAITTICSKPLDITKVDQTVHDVMDSAGRIAKVIADAKARSASP